VELKHLSLVKTEIKAASDGSLKFSGYASVFDGIDTYGDTIVKGAYAKTLMARERPIALRWNHYGPVIGKYVSVIEDEKGLLVEGELTKGHSVAEDVAALLKHGAISGLSIGYYVKDFEMRGTIRALKEIDLMEISLVEDPADNSARVANLKSALSECGELKDIENILQKRINLSQSESTAIVSAIKSIMKRGDRAQMLKTLNQFKLNL
jgi:uncharacterized protein